MRQNRLVLVSFLAAIAFTQGLVFAQSQANTGNIEGIVNDPSGRALAGAQVTVTNLGTNFTRALTSDSEGRFRALLLPLGTVQSHGQGHELRHTGSRRVGPGGGPDHFAFPDV